MNYIKTLKICVYLQELHDIFEKIIKYINLSILNFKLIRKFRSFYKLYQNSKLPKSHIP